MLIRYLARNITFEVNTGAASREAFLVHQTIDVPFQRGIDLPLAEHGACHQVIADADFQGAVFLPCFGGKGSGEHCTSAAMLFSDFVAIFTAPSWSRPLVANPITASARCFRPRSAFDAELRVKSSPNLLNGLFWFVVILIFPPERGCRPQLPRPQSPVRA
jgi:hypothetical protein